MPFARTFSDVGEGRGLLYEDSVRSLALAINRDSAAERPPARARRRGDAVAGELRFGLPHHHHRRCDSTNTRARELAAGGAPAGTIVTADEQSGGRGRQGRAWSAPPGAALLYSAILRPLERRHLLLPLAVPLAVCDAVEAISAHRCGVKWPNDVWIGERKCAGVLIESRPQDGWAVIGVGLNVAIEPDGFPEELRGTRDLGRWRGRGRPRRWRR